MAVSALELRPRTSVGLLDAALRFGGRSSGAWLLTLPGSLGLCVGFIVLLEALEKGGARGPAMWILGLAWCLRGLGQGAACHHLEQRLLATGPALPGASIRAAIGRAPTLLFTATVLGPLTFLWGVFSFGFGLLFWASPQVAYAAAMHRRGPVHRLWREAATSLGASRALAIRVRWLLPFQALLLINLHVAIQSALMLARSLFGLDVAQLSRMATLGNPGWWMVLLVVTFAMMEPVRAAIAVLLLLDGRVRRHGMDLHARLAALPPRGRPLGVAAERPRSKAAGQVALVIGLLSLPFPASAQAPQEPAPHTQIGRLDALVRRCTGSGLGAQEFETLRTWTQEGSLTLSRWVERHERELESHSCARAMQALSRDLAALPVAARPAPPTAETSEAVRAILARSEFELLPPSQKDGAFSSFLDWLERVLEAWLSPGDAPERKRDPGRSWNFGSGLGLSRLLLWALPVIGLLVALWVLGRHVSARRSTRNALNVGSATVVPVEVPASALSQPPATWLRLADGLAAEGRLRDAIRSAYLATLAGLHHQGRIRYAPHHSNWDHLKGFRGEDDARAIFRELTVHFDHAWYGVGVVDATSWQRVRGHTLRLIGQELAVEAAGA